MFGIGIIEFLVIVFVAGVLLFGFSFFIRIMRKDMKKDQEK